MDSLIEDSDRLKPCPFCGGDAEFVSIADEADPCFGGVVAACLRCGAASKVIFPLKDDVKLLLLEQWNQRTADGKAEAERKVLARWMAEALLALCDFDADAEDGGESLRTLKERGERLVAAVLGRPPQTAPNGPQCNLNTPWLAPGA